MSSRLPKEVRIHVEKARESAILAVETYNRPGTAFRSGGYIVLMCIAWTAVFHAMWYRKKVKPFYRDKCNPKRFRKVDGELQTWDLAECVRRHYEGRACAERTNLEFFIGLRNRIEHRSMPELDPRIFGECQALLLNFEELLFAEFGAKYALNESLSLALQFSQLRSSSQTEAIARLHRPLSKDVANYITTFRSALSNEQLHDLSFSFKVFLIPKLANHPGQGDVAVEFVKYDPADPAAMEKYEKLVALTKPSVTQVANQGRLKASDVAKAVQPVVQQIAGADKKFGASSQHVKACNYYRIRPKKGHGDPRKTAVEYCHYDEAHKDYVYTEAWRKFLCEEMKKPGQYERVVKEG